MTRIHENLPRAEFEIPANVQQATICAESGLLAGLGCSTKTEYFETSTIPTVRCTQHYVPPTPEPTPEPTEDPLAGENTGDGTTPDTGTTTPDNGTTTDPDTGTAEPAPDPGTAAPTSEPGA